MTDVVTRVPEAPTVLTSVLGELVAPCWEKIFTIEPAVTALNVHDSVTLRFDTLLDPLVGVAGGRPFVIVTEPISAKAPKPTSFATAALNLYVLPGVKFGTSICIGFDAPLTL